MSLDRRSLLKLLPIAGVQIPLQKPAEAIPLPKSDRIIAVLHLRQPTSREHDRRVYEVLRANLDALGMNDVGALVVPAFAELDFYVIPQGDEQCSVSEPSKSASSASSR